MFNRFFQSLRSAGAAMRAGGIAMRCGYSVELPEIEVKEKKKDDAPPLSGFERDAAKLAGDWQRIGNDIRHAMRIIDDEIKGE